MRLKLVDCQNQKDVAVELKVEYSSTPNGLFAIFINEKQVTGLNNGNDSAPYDEYCFKKVLNMFVGVVKYEGYNYTLTLGAYLDISDIKYFLIDEQGDDKYIRFRDDVSLNEMFYERVKLCNYSEYKEVCEITGKEVPSFKDFIASVCNGKLNYNDYTLYNTIAKQQDFNLFVNNNDFYKFLDLEEAKTNR